MRIGLSCGVNRNVTPLRSSKTALTTTPVLAIPDMNQPFIIQTDASGYAMGGSLEQVQNGKRRVIAYMSKKFTPVENRWPPYERELFAIYSACKAWRHYIAGADIKIESDHKPLIWLKSQKTLSRKQANWVTFLEEFNFIIDYVPGKDMLVADPLSRRPDLDDQKHVDGDPKINYHAINDQQGRWVLRPSVFSKSPTNMARLMLTRCLTNIRLNCPGEGNTTFTKHHCLESTVS